MNKEEKFVITISRQFGTGGHEIGAELAARLGVKLIDKQLLLDAGANKVEFITEKVQAIQAQASGIDEKYDKDGIRKEYLSFCESKDIDSKLGLNYLDKM